MVFTIQEPVFKTATLFVLGCTHEQLNTYLQRRFKLRAGDDLGQVGQMLTFVDHAPWRLVWSCDTDLSTLLHECFHLVTRICMDKGIPIRAHDDRGECADEAAAYLFEFFATALLRKLPASKKRRQSR